MEEMENMEALDYESIQEKVTDELTELLDSRDMKQLQRRMEEMNEFDVREFCEGKIARYKIPKYIFFVKEFPMTGSGKIQKFKLKDLGLELCKQQGIEII